MNLEYVETFMTELQQPRSVYYNPDSNPMAEMTFYITFCFVSQYFKKSQMCLNGGFHIYYTVIQLYFSITWRHIQTDDGRQQLHKVVDSLNNNSGIE